MKYLVMKPEAPHFRVGPFDSCLIDEVLFERPNITALPCHRLW